MDRFQQMQALVAVMDCGGFSRAAEHLGVSAAAMSRGIHELETRLGVRLLHRTTRRLSLTVEGQRFYQRGKELLGELQALEDDVQHQQSLASGRLRLNVPVSFGHLHLAPLWGEFCRRYPAVALEITLADRLVDLVEEGYDLAVRIARLPSSTLVSRPLASTRVVLCASPAYLAEYGRPEQLADLEQHRLIAYDYAARRDEWVFSGPDGPVSFRGRPTHRSNSGDTCRALALAHQGVIFQPTFLIGDDLACGRLEALLPAFRGPTLGIYAVYPSRQHVPPKVRVMIDFLREQLRLNERNFSGDGV